MLRMYCLVQHLSERHCEAASARMDRQPPSGMRKVHSDPCFGGKCTLTPVSGMPAAVTGAREAACGTGSGQVTAGNGVRFTFQKQGIRVDFFERQPIPA